MTKFSELVKYRNTFAKKVESINFQKAIDDICYQLKLSITENYDQNNELVTKAIDQAIIDYQSMVTMSDTILKNLQEIIADFDLKIEKHSSFIDEQGAYILVEIESETGKTEQSKTTFLIDDDIHQAAINQILKYADWHYPALRLGCRYAGQNQIEFQDGMLVPNYTKSIDYSDVLVVNDPLYFCDHQLEFINNVTGHFNDVYSKRIRKYVIKDHNLTQLPQGQFGFVFCWMMLNYVNSATLESYLRSIFDLLRPGGVLVFSYNNTELAESAQISENGKMHSILKRNLITLAERIGYTVMSTVDMPNSDPIIRNISWIEIQKPGLLNSIKLAQAIGTIKLI